MSCILAVVRSSRKDRLSQPKNIRPGQREPTWTFLSSHTHVLLCLARDPDMRLRDVADSVVMTERGVHRIITELEAAGVVERAREGRRNHYEVHPGVVLRHPSESTFTVGTLLESLRRKERSR